MYNTRQIGIDRLSEVKGHPFCAGSITDANGPLTLLCVCAVIPLHLPLPKQRDRLCDCIDMLLCVPITFSAAQS